MSHRIRDEGQKLDLHPSCPCCGTPTQSSPQWMIHSNTFGSKLCTWAHALSCWLQLGGYWTGNSSFLHVVHQSSYFGAPLLTPLLLHSLFLGCSFPSNTETCRKWMSIRNYKTQNEELLCFLRALLVLVAIFLLQMWVWITDHQRSLPDNISLFLLFLSQFVSPFCSSERTEKLDYLFIHLWEWDFWYLSFCALYFRFICRLKPINK